jgi:hypothetical protein
VLVNPVYNIDSHPLISETYTNLDPSTQQKEHNILAELLLGLKAPAITGNPGEELKMAVALQVNFQLEQALVPHIVRSQMSSVPGQSTTYRDRYVDPAAWAIVARVLQVRTVRYTPTAMGV